MQSLSDLNNISNAEITYTDERPSGIILDYETFFYYNQIAISSTTVAVSPVINIAEIIHPETANVRYQITIHTDRSPMLSSSTISWASLPSGVTLSTVGSTYTLSNITTVEQWNLIKTVTWNLPSNYASCPFWYLEFKVIYYDSSESTDKNYNWLKFDNRFYYMSIMDFTSSLKANVSEEVGAIRDFIAALSSQFTTEIRLSKTGSVDLVCKFTLEADESGVNTKLTKLESNFEITCTPRWTSAGPGSLGNVLCRSYMDTVFDIELLPTYTFGPTMVLTAVSSIMVVSRFAKVNSGAIPITTTFTVISTVVRTRRLTASVSSSFTMSINAITDHIYNLDQTRYLSSWPFTSGATVTYSQMTPVFPSDIIPYMETGSATITATVFGSRYFAASSAAIVYNMNNLLDSTSSYNITRWRYWPSVNNNPYDFNIVLTIVKNGVTTTKTIYFEPYFVKMLPTFTLSASVTPLVRRATASVSSAFTVTASFNVIKLINWNVNRSAVIVSPPTVPSYSSMTQFFTSNIPDLIPDPADTRSYVLRFAMGTLSFRLTSSSSLVGTIDIEMNPNNVNYDATVFSTLRCALRVTAGTTTPELCSVRFTVASTIIMSQNILIYPI